MTGVMEHEIDLVCLTNNKAYSMLNKDDAYVKLTVVELGDKAVLDLGFSLHTPKANDMLIRDNIRLLLTPQQVKTLLAPK